MQPLTRFEQWLRQDGDLPDGAEEPVRDWTDSEYLIVNNFADLAARRIELKHKQDHLQKEIEGLNLEIGAMLQTADIRSVRFGHHRLALGQSTTGGRLDKGKLLEQGVTAEQLARATSPKRLGKLFITVTQLKGPED